MTQSQASTTTLKPPQALALLREQAGLFAQLEAFAGRQRDLVNGDDVNPLIALLAQRQRVVARLAEVGQALAPVRREWNSFRAVLEPGDRAEAGKLLEASQSCLQRVITGDERDARVLSARKSRVVNLLGDISRGGSAAAAYTSQARRDGRINLVSEDA